MCVYGQEYLNCTLAIESPFQTFAVGLLVKFIGEQSERPSDKLGCEYFFDLALACMFVTIYVYVLLVCAHSQV